jgi:hypothetical protein
VAEGDAFALALLLPPEPLPSVELHAVRAVTARISAADREIKRRIYSTSINDRFTIPP